MGQAAPGTAAGDAGKSVATWMLVALVLAALGFRLASVWLNIERTDLAYGIEQAENDIEKISKHVAKLEVERDNLLSPFQLKELALKHGLGPAEPGQIRRLPLPAE
jgi:cell division protein FtsL